MSKTLSLFAGTLCGYCGGLPGSPTKISDNLTYCDDKCFANAVIRDYPGTIHEAMVRTLWSTEGEEGEERHGAIQSSVSLLLQPDDEVPRVDVQKISSGGGAMSGNVNEYGVYIETEIVRIPSKDTIEIEVVQDDDGKWRFGKNYHAAGKDPAERDSNIGFIEWVTEQRAKFYEEQGYPENLHLNHETKVYGFGASATIHSKTYNTREDAIVAAAEELKGQIKDSRAGRDIEKFLTDYQQKALF